MKTVVMSLGGSLIVPDEVDLAFLGKFARLIRGLAKKYKIIIVTGGGRTARKYIAVAERAGFSEDEVSLVGIESTRLNAALVAGFFKQERFLPVSFKDVQKQLQKKNVVVCGALGFMPEMTSDGDAALLAAVLHAHIFVNLTNVRGLFTKNPGEAGAKVIPKITFKDFLVMIHKIPFRPGQHFVLDHKAAHLIQKHKIKTFIVDGHDLENVGRCVQGKKCVGTLVYG